MRASSVAHLFEHTSKHAHSMQCLRGTLVIAELACAPLLVQLVHAAGAQYLEAPVSGSKGPAEQGTLIFLAGGDEELYQSSGPLLDVMGKAKFFLGPVRIHSARS